MPRIKLTFRLPLLLLFLLSFSVAANCQNNGRMRDSAFLRPIDTTLSDNAQLLAKLERMYFVLNRVSNSTDQAFDTKSIEEQLPGINSNLQVIGQSLGNSNSLTLRNLQLFQVTLQDMLQSLRDWRTSLTDYNKQLITMNSNLADIMEDTVVKNYTADTTLRSMYSAKISELKIKLSAADSIARSGLLKIDRLQTNVSDQFLAAVDLRRNVRRQLKKFSGQTFSKEAPYLWQAISEKEKKKDGNSLKAERKIMQYYFNNSKESRYYMLILGVLFFIWVFVNNFYIRKKKISLDSNEYRILFIRFIPFFSACVFMLTLAPLFDLHPPANYVSFLQFLLLVALTFLLGRTWPKRLFYCWIGFVVLFLLFGFTHLLFSSVLIQRWWFILLNVAGIALALVFLPRIGKSWALYLLVRSVVIASIVLNAAAIIANVFGRTSFSETLTTASIFGVTQIVGLSVFIKIIIEAIYLQLVRLRAERGFAARFNFISISKKIVKILSVLSFLLWLMVFTTNLNIYDSIYSSVNRFLTQRRTIGSTGFSFGNIALFFIIIYVANLIQKYISYFWDNGEDSIIPTKRRGMGSRLLFTRLILLTLGFLLAVAASGLPLDKITIILGALGVGIGLGLQNIVNNLVSGIVLIFERPLEVGDSIEVRDKKGVVKEINLRSTKLISDAGAEIIIPNGDFLSEHVTNWTLTNNFVRLEITFYVPAQVDMVTTNNLIIDTIKANKNVEHSFPPGIVVDNANARRLKLKVQFWYTDIRQGDEMKSEVLMQIREAFKKNNIEIV
jgi:potassium efflux system protein